MVGRAAGAPAVGGIDHGRAVGRHRPAARPRPARGGGRPRPGARVLKPDGQWGHVPEPRTPADQAGAAADRRYRAELNDVEGTVNAQVRAWRDGRPTPVGPALRAMRTRWRALRPGEELIVEWPTRRLSRPSSRDRPVPARRRRGP